MLSTFDEVGDPMKKQTKKRIEIEHRITIEHEEVIALLHRAGYTSIPKSATLFMEEPSPYRPKNDLVVRWTANEEITDTINDLPPDAT